MTAPIQLVNHTTGSAKRAVRQSAKPTKTLPFIIPLIISLIAGLLFSFALAPYKFWLLAIVSPMMFYACLMLENSSKRAFWLGQAYGFGTWAVGAFWLYVSIHEYGNVSGVVAFLMIVVMAMLMGLFHAAMAWVFVRFMGRQPLAFASLWVLQEWLKTWLLTGFPWLFVGYAFTDLPWLTSLAPIVGVLGVSFVAVFFASALFEAVRQRLGYLLIGVILLFVGMVLYWVNPTWTQPTGQKLSVSLIQGNIPQDLKWLTEYRFKTLEIYANLSQNEWGRDVVIWPEASIPMFQDEAWGFIDNVAQVAKATGSTWITGVPYRDIEHFNPDTQAYPNFYNGVLAVGDKSGGLYKKQRLVPFGEYIPFQGLLNILPDLAGMQNTASFSRGDTNQQPLTIKNHRMGSAICYEVAYPDTTRKNAMGTEFLLTVSNDAWFGTSAGPHQHLQMVQMRSLETGRWFVRATNTGITALIDDKGQIASQVPQFMPTVLRGDVPMMKGMTPFMRFGHYPLLILVGVLLVMSMVAKHQNHRDASREKSYRADGVLD